MLPSWLALGRWFTVAFFPPFFFWFCFFLYHLLLSIHWKFGAQCQSIHTGQHSHSKQGGSEPLKPVLNFLGIVPLALMESPECHHHSNWKLSLAFISSSMTIIIYIYSRRRNKKKKKKKKKKKSNSEAIKSKRITSLSNTKMVIALQLMHFCHSRKWI